jgi:hypothetical protein
MWYHGRIRCPLAIAASESSYSTPGAKLHLPMPFHSYRVDIFSSVATKGCPKSAVYEMCPLLFYTSALTSTTAGMFYPFSIYHTFGAFGFG